MSSKKLRFKKLLNQYRYLVKEQEFVAEIMEEANKEFDFEYRDFCIKNDLDYEEMTGREPPENSDSEEIEQYEKDAPADEPEKIKIPFHIRQLFKNIARALHPDSLAASDPEFDDKVKEFKEATNAMNKGQWGVLLDIADKRDVKVTNYAKIAKAIKEDIDRIEKEIAGKKQTFAWHVYECEEEDDCIERLLRTFLQVTKGITTQG
tara:strand:- start:79 stop:696 length:618 start_codon:yes stop_codon:yes gene_type:complete